MAVEELYICIEQTTVENVRHENKGIPPAADTTTPDNSDSQPVETSLIVEQKGQMVEDTPPIRQVKIVKTE